MAILNYSDILRGGGALSGLQRQSQVAQGLQQTQMNAEALRQLRNKAAQEDAQLARESELQSAAVEAFQSGDPNKVAQLAIQSPELSKRILQAQGIVDQAGLKRVSDRFASVATSTNPREALAQSVEQGRAAGLNMSDSEAILNSDMTDDQIRQQALVSLASIDPNRQQSIQSAMVGEQGQAPSSVREYQFVQGLSPEEKAEYYRTKRGDTATPEQKFQQEQRKGELKIKQEQTKEERKIGVKDLRDIAERSRGASTQLATLNRIGQLNKKALDGTLAESRLELLKLGRSLGLDIEGVTESEMLRAIANDAVLAKSQQMSGALSNADMQFLSNTAPQLSQTADGRAKIIEYGKALAERERDYAEAAQRFRKDNGYFNLSEFNSQFDADNKPLFSDEQTQDETVPAVETFTTAGGITYTVEG